MPIKCLAYVYNFIGIFVSGTCMAVMWNIYCSWLCFLTNMHQHQIVMLKKKWGQFHMYLQCGSHICSVMYASNMKYSLQCKYKVVLFTCDANDRHVVNMCRYLQCMALKDMAYMWNLVGIFVSGSTHFILSSLEKRETIEAINW